ncbi:uncharacterized protein LOC143282460 isoform X2 [Babylonia areolata]|uniref:uncharacterized protein LOC143282460 isoform X2 n=1 Tax=Babylonia areolata TaxID=304850 RepID=UPI003FD115A1
MLPPLWSKLLLLLTVGGPTVYVQANLLHNSGFESLASWHCWSFQCSLSNTAHSGHHSVQVTGRKHVYDGPSQDIHVTAGHTYDVSAYVKLLTQTDSGGEKLQVMMTIDTPDGPQYQAAATHLSAHVTDGWVKLTGEFTVPNAVQRARYKIQGPEPSVEFLVDDAMLTEVTRNNGTMDWRNATDEVINAVRKSDIHIRVTNSGKLNPADVTIQVVQKTKSFPFGTMVKTAEYNDNAANGKYRDFIHRHFNWAVLANALKWPAMERNQGELRYQEPLEAIHGLKDHGLKVRGHNIVWSVSRHIQPWIQELTGNALRHAVEKRINDVMNITHGLLEHWDVNNENLHGQWFQDTLHDPHYNLDIFRMAHHADPSVKLFLNDFNVVASGQMTQAYLNQAREFKAAGVGLYGMGVQCHFHPYTQPDPVAVKEHLDTLAQAGIPIWVTELDTVAKDENQRAEYYERALRALYGHPAVQGIMLWGFWAPTTWRGEDGALVTGDNFELTAAGRRVLDLLEREWMTDETHVLAESGEQWTVRGFHGDYEVHVRHQGQQVTTHTFTLTAQPATVHLTL